MAKPIISEKESAARATIAGVLDGLDQHSRARVLKWAFSYKLREFPPRTRVRSCRRGAGTLIGYEGGRDRRWAVVHYDDSEEPEREYPHLLDEATS